LHKKQLHIIGAGGLATDLIACFSPFTEFAGMWADHPAANESKHQLSYLGSLVNLLELQEGIDFIIAIGNPKIRSEIYFKLLQAGHKPATLIHPRATIYDDSSVHIGTGTIIFPAAVLTSGLTVGENCVIHVGCSLHHDTIFGNHSVMMPGARITGNAEIGEQVFIGANQVVGNGMKVAGGTRMI
jgi:sugar O-acyltransferase (sialic acid O-acetyltransferase NeuD family)